MLPNSAIFADEPLNTSSSMTSIGTLYFAAKAKRGFLSSVRMMTPPKSKITPLIDIHSSFSVIFLLFYSYLQCRKKTKRGFHQTGAPLLQDDPITQLYIKSGLR